MADDISYAQQLLGLSPQALTELEQEGAPGIDSADPLPVDQSVDVPVAQSAMPASLAPNPVEAPAVPFGSEAPLQRPAAFQFSPEVLSTVGLTDTANMYNGVQAPVAAANPAVVGPGPMTDTEQAIQNAAAQQQVAEAVQPTPEQVQQAHAELAAPIQHEKAKIEAQKMVNHDLRSNILAEKQAAEDQQAAIQKELNKQDESVRIKSLPEIMQQGSWGEKLGASIALLIGGVSQGLTGAKTNPVLDFIDTQVERQAKKDHLRSEEKLALRKQLADLAQTRLKALSDASDDMYKRGTLDNAAQQLELEKQRWDADRQLKTQEFMAKRSTAQVSAAFDAGQEVADLSGLDEDRRKRAVRLPHGGFKSAANPAITEKLNGYVNDVQPAIDGIDRIMGLAKNLNRITDLKKRAQIASEVKALGGQLRLPFTGPGALTEKEFDRLMDTIGNPNSLAALPSLEKAKLMTVKSKLQSDMKQHYKQAGIDLPLSRQDQLVENLKAKGYAEEDIKRVLEKRQ